MSKLYEKYNNKAISTRLKGHSLEYFLKYAKRRNAKSISDAFQKMVDELQSHLDLTRDPVPEELFTSPADPNAEAAKTMFLNDKEIEPKKLSMDEVAEAKAKEEEEQRLKELEEQKEQAAKEELSANPEPEKTDDEEDDNDNEEVITI